MIQSTPHNYCKNYGIQYLDIFIKAVINKPEYSAKDIEVLDTAYLSNNPIFINCSGYIYRQFNEIGEKIYRHIIRENPEDTWFCFHLYEKHIQQCLFGIDSIVQSDFNLYGLVSKLTSVEHQILDRFAVNYVRTRGLLRRTDFSNIRITPPYYAWMQQVKIRDGERCVRCGSSKNLVAHHITPVSVSPEIATDVNNGITFCEKCHNDYHSYYRISQCHHKTLHSFISGYKGGARL